MRVHPGSRLDTQEDKGGGVTETVGGGVARTCYTRGGRGDEAESSVEGRGLTRVFIKRGVARGNRLRESDAEWGWVVKEEFHFPRKQERNSGLGNVEQSPAVSLLYFTRSD